MRRITTNSDRSHGDSEIVHIVRGLRQRQPEIERSILDRVVEVEQAARVTDAEYRAGLRAAVGAVIDYSLTCLDQGEDWVGSVPPAAISQVRRAVYGGVSLETVMLRYIAGYRQLNEFIADEAEAASVPLCRLRRIQDSLLQRLTTTVAKEYRLEEARRSQSVDQRHGELVRRLLAGESVATVELDYGFDAWHLGVIATGSGAEKALRAFSATLGCQLLRILSGHETLWAWFGRQKELPSTDILRLSQDADQSISLAIGEPAWGISGWRLTHAEAQTAHEVVMNRPKQATRCIDVLLDAAVLRDEIVGRALMVTFLAPLDNLRMGGDAARRTLKAYFACSRSAAKTAGVLHVTRKTVENRLRDIEKAIGRPLTTCLAELEVALRLENDGSGNMKSGCHA